MTTARIMLERHSTEPTDKSMPPVMMTIVMPSAMIAKKVRLRVMLKRLLVVANEFVATDRNAQAATSAINTQNVWLDVKRPNQSARLGGASSTARVIVSISA